MSVKGGLYMLKVFKNEKLWCAVAGAAAVIVGKKIIAFKFKRRKGFHKKKGSRRAMTKLEITAINA